MVSARSRWFPVAAEGIARLSPLALAAVRACAIVALALAVGTIAAVQGCNKGGSGGGGLKITKVTPNQGPTTGGTNVTIEGRDFAAGATITVGGVTASNIVIVSGTQATFTTPPAPGGVPGAVQVIIFNPNNQSDGAKFTYVGNGAPSITASVTPGLNGHYSVAEGGTLTFMLTANDPDGDNLSAITETHTGVPNMTAVNLASGPAGAPPVTATFTYTPALNQAPPGGTNTYTVTFSVTDQPGGGGGITTTLVAIIDVQDTGGPGPGPGPGAAADYRDGRTFPTGVAGASAASPFRIVSEDFNGDTFPDLAITNVLSDNISILLGDGNGGFDPPNVIPVSPVPGGIAAGDLNGDGEVDLAVVSNTALLGAALDELTILFGNGNGGFAIALNTGIDPTAGEVVIADFDETLEADIAIAHAVNAIAPGFGQVTIIFNDGTGNDTGLGFTSEFVDDVGEGSPSPRPS